LTHNLSQDRLETIRQDYNRIAQEYAAHIYKELDRKPFDREKLLAFAAAVSHRGPICDMGCGPGHVARFLRDAGAEVFGLDLSPGMVEQARSLNPDIDFRVGDMLALPLADGCLAGIAAFYSIVNLPPESLPAVFAEMHRALQPGGLLLLAFHAGDEVIRPAEEWGQPISMEFIYHLPHKVRQLLSAAGFAIDDVQERVPYAPEVEYQSRRAYILARKAEGGSETSAAGPGR
jgi:SAM-dependent methyltransferase